MVKDAWRAEKWVDKLTIWFKPTGWRPEGFEEKYPVTKIQDHYKREKFNPHTSRPLFVWATIQFLVIFFIFLHVLNNPSELVATGIYALTLFVFSQIFSATELMNRNKWSPFFTIFSSIVGIVIYYFDTTFFGIDKVSSLLPIAFLVYFVLQVILSFIINKQQDAIKEN